MDGSNLRLVLSSPGGYFFRQEGVIRYWGPTADSHIDFSDPYFDAVEHKYWPYSDGMWPDNDHGAGYNLLPDCVETRFAAWCLVAGVPFFDVREMSESLIGLLCRVECEPENEMAWCALQDQIEDEVGISVQAIQNKLRV